MCVHNGERESPSCPGPQVANRVWRVTRLASSCPVSRAGTFHQPTAVATLFQEKHIVCPGRAIASGQQRSLPSPTPRHRPPAPAHLTNLSLSLISPVSIPPVQAMGLLARPLALHSSRCSPALSPGLQPPLPSVPLQPHSPLLLCESEAALHTG